jgi:hypothetical protein
MVATYGAPFSCVSQTQASNFLRKFSTWATKPSARHLRARPNDFSRAGLSAALVLIPSISYAERFNLF